MSSYNASQRPLSTRYSFICEQNDILAELRHVRSAPSRVLFDIRCADRRIFSAMACQLMSFIQGVTFRESLVHYFVPWFIFFGFTFCVVHNNISFHFGIIIGKKWEMRWLLWPIILHQYCIMASGFTVLVSLWFTELVLHHGLKVKPVKVILFYH